MTTTDTQEQIRDQQTESLTSPLAESARRHLAYERLARQVAAGEAAARLVLDALARKQQAAGAAETTEE